MALYRAQVATHEESAIARDYCINNLYFDVGTGIVFGGAELQTLANDIRAAFGLRSNQPRFYGTSCSIYDMADPKPRPRRAFAPWVASPGATTSESGPREVAVCLSYYSGRNLPSQRGRIYVGPFQYQALSTPRPDSAVRGSLVALAGRLEGIGGINVDWSVYSTKQAIARPITNGWVDDEWDTQRSRGLRSLARTTFTTAEA